MLGTSCRLAAAVLTAGLMAVAAPAHATPGTLEAGPGVLVADGAAVDIPVTFTCDTDPGLIMAVPLVQLSQRVSDGRIASGIGSDQISCTKQSQTVTLRVVPTVMAFDEGTAAATLLLQSCTVQFQCSTVIVHTELTLTKPASTGLPPQQ